MLSFLVRLVISAFVLKGTAYIVPGFSIGGFGTALLAALVIALGQYLLVNAFGARAQLGRGVASFLVAAAVIWAVQFIVAGVYVTITGALLAALVIGIADYLVPTLL